MSLLCAVSDPLDLVHAGFFSACLAADHPNLVSGLVLLNSAGPVNPDYVPPAASSNATAAGVDPAGSAGSGAPGGANGKGPMNTPGAKTPPPGIVAEAMARGLMLFLQTTARRTLK